MLPPLDKLETLIQITYTTYTTYILKISPLDFGGHRLDLTTPCDPCFTLGTRNGDSESLFP